MKGNLLNLMEEKYQKKISRWLTYLSVPVSIVFIIGYLIGDDIGGLLASLGAIIPFTSFILVHISLKYGGKHLLTIGAVGGLSYGMIFWFFGTSVLNLRGIEINHYLLLAVILMGLFAIFATRNKFTDFDQLMIAGQSMMVTFLFGAVLAVILAILFGLIFGNIGAWIGFLSGFIIMIIYHGNEIGEHFDLGETEIYSPTDAGIILAGVGGLLGLGMNMFYTYFYSSLYYKIGSIQVPLASIILLIAGVITGFFSAYLTQRMKKRIDETR